jgi:hypothetical protein
MIFSTSNQLLKITLIFVSIKNNAVILKFFGKTLNQALYKKKYLNYKKPLLITSIPLKSKPSCIYSKLCLNSRLVPAYLFLKQFCFDVLITN